VGILTSNTASLMGREQNISSRERSHPDILDDVVVVADQDCGPETFRKIKYGVAVTAADCRMLEGL
jgi:hypothetical protein